MGRSWQIQMGDVVRKQVRERWLRALRAEELGTTLWMIAKEGVFCLFVLLNFFY